MRRSCDSLKQQLAAALPGLQELFVECCNKRRGCVPVEQQLRDCKESGVDQLTLSGRKKGRDTLQCAQSQRTIPRTTRTYTGTQAIILSQ
jgi:hypothetical protein